MFKHLAILGFGISAVSTAKFFLKNYPQVKIRISELKSRSNFDENTIKDLEKQNIEFEFGLQSKEFITFNQASNLFIMVSPGIPPKAPIITTVKESGADFGTDLDLLLLLSKAKKIAVTGTNGKTTTVSLIAHILGNEPLGNVGKPFLEYQDLRFQEILALEISSFQLFYSNAVNESQYLPDISVYLNLTDDHLDWHSSLEEYRESKAKIFKDLPGKVLVMNYDDPIVKDLAGSKSNIRFFSVESKVNSGACFSNDTLYLDDKPLIKISELNLVGKHNYSNILAAVLATQAAGINLEHIKTQIRTFKPVPHRLEYTGIIDGHKFYNDSKATNPDSANKGLEAFAKSIAIVGGKNKNLDLNSFINKLIERCEGVVAIGELKASIIQALKQKSFNNVVEAMSLEQAVDKALLLAKNHPQIPIVLAPASSSFDMFKNYEERGDQFKEIVYTRTRAAI